MAERRMFAKTIIDSDAFMDMPIGARCLYYDLGMRADDDGFLNNPKKVQKMIGASEDDLKWLIIKNFIIPFESGVIVIKHWRIHNYIRNDRYKKTVYEEEYKQLSVKNNNAYTLIKQDGIPNGYQMDTNGIPNVHQMETQVRLGKGSIGKIINKEVVKKPKKPPFIPPKLEEVEAYIKEKDYKIDAQNFIDFYASKGWMVGKNKMVNWQACVRTWVKRDATQKNTRKQGSRIETVTVYPNEPTSGMTEEELEQAYREGIEKLGLL